MGCKPKTQGNAKDFSKTNTVCALLGEEGKEIGNGLEHDPTPGDGLTSRTVLDGVPCRHLNLEEAKWGYLYFAIDPTFKKGSTMDVTVEIEYFDDKEGDLRLQFDASRSKKALNSAYAKVSKQDDPAKFRQGLQKALDVEYADSKDTVRFSKTKSWETGMFHIRGATFRNSQNGGADFRFCVNPPELYVRRVAVIRYGR